MTFVGHGRGSRRAGRSSIDQFRARRRKVLRESWRDWLPTVAFAGGCIVAAVLFDSRSAALIFAGLAGSAITLCLLGWFIGGDVYSLPWMWGAIGERQTAETLDGLDDSWTCEHDLPRRRGNWDHVLIGPPGVFLLESKRLTPGVAVEGDALVAGRSSYAGGGFRGSAASLHEALAPRMRRPFWVRAVVVVWGDFPQRRVEKDRVV